MKYIAVIDMEISNIKSIVAAIRYFGFDTIITKNENMILNSSALILPGVGSFPAGMKILKKNKLDLTIKKFIKTKKPVLAICLGYQLLFSSSMEFKYTKGLDVLKGKVLSLKSLKTKRFTPNIGWNLIGVKKDKNNTLFSKLNSKIAVYFVHSFFVKIEKKNLETSTIDFGEKKIVSSIQDKNLFGVQFHPEKSGKDGLKIIKNFLNKIK